LRKKNQAI